MRSGGGGAGSELAEAAAQEVNLRRQRMKQRAEGTMSSSNLLSGFTRLCKGLAVVLVGAHIVVQILPSAVSFLALIPAK
nr:rhomboid-like protein 19 [Ipomoea batatas]